MGNAVRFVYFLIFTQTHAHIQQLIYVKKTVYVCDNWQESILLIRDINKNYYHIINYLAEGEI